MGFEKYGKTIDVSIKGSYENEWEDLYVYSGEENTVLVFSDSYYNYSEISIQDRLYKYGERISKYCRVSAVSQGFFPINGTSNPEVEVFDVEVQQTPAFLMMVLADLVPSAEDGGKRGGSEDELFGLSVAPIGFSVASKFNDAKEKFCLAAADSERTMHIARVGGMVDAHLPETYYFIATKL